MCLLPQDERHLSHALGLARDAAAFASPNPTVGCVLTRGDEVLGEGAHHYDARDHAEIVALKQAASSGHSTRGATAYVTLEPCSHQGRTGPCADALIAAGITRCIIATVDPNPQVRGQGIAKLRAAGIEVLLADPASATTKQARRLNDAFAFSIATGRPFVTLKAALSIDGKLAPPPSTRTANAPHWLTGEAARNDVHQLRHTAEAVVTGIGTVLADDPKLTDRTGLARRRPLLRAVLDSDLRIPIESALVASASQDLIVFCRAYASEEREGALRRRGVEIQRLADDSHRLDLRAVEDVLSYRAPRNILIEGGSRLNASYLKSELVSKVLLYYSETELGPDAIPFAYDYPSPYVLQQQLHQTERQSFPHGQGEDIRISGYIRDPWADIDTLIPNP